MAIVDFYLSFIKKYKTRRSILKEINNTEKELQDLKKKFKKEEIDEARYTGQKEFREKRLVILGVELEILNEIRRFEKISHTNIDKLEETRIRHLRQMYMKGRTFLDKIEAIHTDFIDEKIDLGKHHEKIMAIRDQLKKLNQDIIDVQEKKDVQIERALEEEIKHPGLTYEEGEKELEEKKEAEEAEALEEEVLPRKEQREMAEEISKQEEYEPKFTVKPSPAELKYPKESERLPKEYDKKEEAVPEEEEEYEIMEEEPEKEEVPPEPKEKPKTVEEKSDIPPKPVMPPKPPAPPKKSVFEKLKEMFKKRAQKTKQEKEKEESVC